MSDNVIDDKTAANAELLVPSERRDYPRIALSVPVQYSVVKETKASGDEHDRLLKMGNENTDKKTISISRTENVSSGGLLMDTADEHDPGTTLHITMHLPLPGLSCACSILGEVIRCDKREGGTYKTAIKFIKIVHHNLNKYKYASLKELLDIDGPEIKLG